MNKQLLSVHLLGAGLPGPGESASYHFPYLRLPCETAGIRILSCPRRKTRFRVDKGQVLFSS